MGSGRIKKLLIVTVSFVEKKTQKKSSGSHEYLQALVSMVFLASNFTYCICTSTSIPTFFSLHSCFTHSCFPLVFRTLQNFFVVTEEEVKAELLPDCPASFSLLQSQCVFSEPAER